MKNQLPKLTTEVDVKADLSYKQAKWERMT
jgi:hypothetical protein